MSIISLKICLVYFDIKTGYYPGLHHGLAYLSGYLKKNGFPIQFHHATDENMVSDLCSGLNDADVIGCSIVTNQLHYFDRFVGMLSSEFTGKLVAGGVHPTLMYREMLENYPRLDAVCIGEGELSFLEYLRALQSCKDLSLINGFAFRKENGEISVNRLTCYSKIEDLGTPDYSIFDYEKIIANSAHIFPMMLSRGCPFSCSYCSNHALQHAYESQRGYVRFPNVDYAINIIKNNLKIYPKAKSITFADDTFILNKTWITEFCRRYKQEIGLPFDCNAKVETVSGEILKVLKDARCIILHLGVESGNEWLRKNILNRKQTDEQIIDAFKLAKKYHFKTTSSTMTGLPFETQTMFNDTFKLIRKIRPNFGSCFYFYPYPQTDLWEMCKKYDLLTPNYESSSGYLEKPSIGPIFIPNKQIRDNLSKMKFYFMLRVISARIPIPKIIESVILFVAIKPIRNRFVLFMTGQSRLKYFIRKIGYFIKNK